MAEGRTNVDPAALSTTPRAFGVTFAPTRPTFAAGTLRWVDVGAAGTVAYMFDFAGDPRFPADGRVQVEESLSTMTQDQLTKANWAGAHSFTAVGPITILLRWYGDVADASFIRGGVLYDFVGPALSPTVALDLARQLARELG